MRRCLLCVCVSVTFVRECLCFFRVRVRGCMRLCVIVLVFVVVHVCCVCLRVCLRLSLCVVRVSLCVCVDDCVHVCLCVFYVYLCSCA